MKINFEHLRYKNFIGAGNTWVEWDLTKFRSSIITGVNGEGKSTMLDGLTYALYNKAFRKKTPVGDLVNNINKKLMIVELTFSINADKYKVIRGRKPNVFEIYKNDELINQESHNGDQQTYLETVVLGMSFKTFIQVVIIGKSNFEPFMELTTADRRNVVENVLDMRIMSDMNATLKTWDSALAVELDGIKGQLQTVERSIEIIETNKQQVVDQWKQQIADNALKIQEAGEKGLAASTKKKELDVVLADREKELYYVNDAYMQYSQIEMYIRNCDSDIAKYKHKLSSIENIDVCECCQQKVTDEHRDVVRLQTEISIVKMQEYREKHKEQLFELGNPDTLGMLLQADIDKLKSEISELAIEARTQMSIINSARHSNDLLKAKIDSFEGTNGDAAPLYQDQASYKQALEDGVNKALYFKYLKSLLRDDGIKAYAIKHYLPTINEYFYEYMQLLGMNVRITLDEEFNETIVTRPFNDLSYYSFSEGQKARINLALLLTWRKVAEYKNSVNTNLLILDEVFDGSIDTAGSASFAQLLRQLSAECHVFVISHNEMMIEQFENHYIVRKSGGFSKVHAGVEAGDTIRTV